MAIRQRLQSETALGWEKARTLTFAYDFAVMAAGITGPDDPAADQIAAEIIAIGKSQENVDAGRLAAQVLRRLDLPRRRRPPGLDGGQSSPPILRSPWRRP